MLDDQSIELINAGVDGELQAEDILKLDALLESSEEARELHAEMLRLTHFLNALPDQRPPKELSSQILDSIKLPRKVNRFSLRGLFTSIQPLATASAFAAGLLVTIGFYEMTPQRLSPGDVNKMVGTAVLKSDDETGIPPGQKEGMLKLDESWVSGSVSLQRKKSLYVLNFNLDSTGPVGVELGLIDADLEFAGIAQEVSQSGSINDDFKVSGGTVHVENQGRQSFVIFLRNTAKKDSGKDINIEFSSGEQRLVKGLSR